MPTIAEEWQWHVFEDRLYETMRGAVPHLILELPNTRESRIAFEALSRAILDHKILSKLSIDDKLDVCYGLAPYSVPRPYRHRPASWSSISLRELMDFPTEHVVDVRQISLTLFQKLDLILCSTIEQGRVFLLSIPDRNCSTSPKPMDVVV